MITPHIGSRTCGSVERQATMAARNLILAMEGKKPLAQAVRLTNISSLRKTCPRKINFISYTETHNDLVQKAYGNRGFDTRMSAAAKFSAYATTHGSYSQCLKPCTWMTCWLQNGGPNLLLKSLKENRFPSSKVWDCQYKLGRAAAFEAMDRCIELADQYGIGQVSVDHAFHYLWGGGYVMDAASVDTCLHQLHRFNY